MKTKTSTLPTAVLYDLARVYEQLTVLDDEWLRDSDHSLEKSQHEIAEIMSSIITDAVDGGAR